MFAVVAPGIEDHRVRCFLRYTKTAQGWQKLNTEQANNHLQQYHPQYVYHSPTLDAAIHGVHIDSIHRHHQPKQRLQELLQNHPQDTVEQDSLHLIELFKQRGITSQNLGVTGSLLIGAQKHSSDIDLVCYDKPTFQHCRQQIKHLLEHHLLQHLTETDWQEAYDRRGCALSFEEYVWHEQRKYNKAIINSRKFDISLFNAQQVTDNTHYQKCGEIRLQCLVLDDSKAFDYPAEFKIDHPEITSVVSFTATYTGQAQQGERIEVTGLVEQNESGKKRIVIGSSREAQGEYIKVIQT